MAGVNSAPNAVHSGKSFRVFGTAAFSVDHIALSCFCTWSYPSAIVFFCRLLRVTVFVSAESGVYQLIYGAIDIVNFLCIVIFVVIMWDMDIGECRIIVIDCGLKLVVPVRVAFIGVVAWINEGRHMTYGWSE